jgi:hypothetical protein
LAAIAVHKLLVCRATYNPEIEEKNLPATTTCNCSVVFFNTKPVGVSKTFQGGWKIKGNKENKKKLPTNCNRSKYSFFAQSVLWQHSIKQHPTINQTNNTRLLTNTLSRRS